MSNSNKAMELSAITDWETRGRNAGWRVKALANDCGVCPRSLQRFWKKERQIPLAKWLVEQRFALACHLLRATNETIEGVSQLVAYRHIGAFSHAFGLRYGMTPSKWRQVFVNNQPASQVQEKDPQLVSWSRLQSMRFVARS
jgi:transcriptional regulator GlxA family with amidase domain